jgi:phage anti-repressor protein
MGGLEVIESSIVTVYEDKGAKILINAREMRESSEVNWKFADWVHERIGKYASTAGEGFFRFSGKSTKGRPMTEYLLTIEVRKELAMIENNPKGRRFGSISSRARND